jgi:carbon storage regulator
MLVLTRRIGEAIVLPDLGVTVRVLEIDRGRVRLGVEAPPSVVVLRDELVTHRAQAAACPRLTPGAFRLDRF